MGEGGPREGGPSQPPSAPGHSDNRTGGPSDGSVPGLPPEMPELVCGREDGPPRSWHLLPSRENNQQPRHEKMNAARRRGPCVTLG